MLLLRRSPLALAVLLSFAASSSRAQSRGPVMPAYGAAGEAKAAAPEESLDLVGPTEKQKARAEAAKAKAEAEAKAKAEAEAKARAAAEAKAKAEAEARAKAEAEAKAKAEAEAQAKAAAEAKAKAEADARARAEAEAKVRAEAEAQAKAAAEAKARAEADARAKAEAEARAAQAKAAAPAAASPMIAAPPVAAPVRRVITPGAAAPAPLPAAAAAPAPSAAPAAASAHAIAAPVAPAPAVQVAAPAAAPADRAQVEARIRAQVEAQMKAEMEARVRAEVERQLAGQAAQATPAAAPAPAAKADCKPDKKARKKKGAKTGPCIADLALIDLPIAPVAAAPAVPAPAAPAAAPAGGALAAKAAPAAPDKADEAAAAADRKPAMVAEIREERAPGVRVAAASPVAMPAFDNRGSRSGPAAAPELLVPRDEGGRRSRRIAVSDDLTVGPQGLLVNALRASAEVSPEAVSASFTYRALIDDAAAVHHGFFVGAESAQCEATGPCGPRLWASAGLSPGGANTYGVVRKIGGQSKSMADSLSWSSYAAAAGVSGRSAGGFGGLFDAQLQGVTLSYRRNANTAAPDKVDLSLQQLRLRGGAGVQRGGFEGQATVAAYLNLGDGADPTRGIPLRGVFLDPELGGLASGPQALLAKLEGRYELPIGLRLSASYGYLAYAGLEWANAHLLAAQLGQRLGRFDFGLGITAQLDAPQTLPPGATNADYAAVYFSGHVAAAF